MKRFGVSHRSNRRYVISGAMVFCLSQTAFRVEAEELTDSLALSFKERGDRDIDEGNYAAAISAYEKGDRIQHHPVFDFNRARALQGAGRMAEALDALERFDREAPAELRDKVPGFDELLSQLRRGVAGVNLTGDRIDARVSINGRDLGKFEPNKPLRCDPGSLELRVEAEGFRVISKRIRISAGETRTIALKWQPIDERANVRLAASVPGAQLWVDGKPAGQTPIELRLNPGRHRLRLEHPDAQPLQTEIVVDARESRETTLEMVRPAPIWTRWWFWTGTAAVAAGLVITGIALSTSGSPRQGDIAPGVVSGPLMAN